MFGKKKAPPTDMVDLIADIPLVSEDGQASLYCYVYDAFATGALIPAAVGSAAVKELTSIVTSKPVVEARITAEMIDFLSTAGASKNRHRARLAAFISKLAVDASLLAAERSKAPKDEAASLHFCYVIYRNKGCVKMAFREVSWSSGASLAATPKSITDRVSKMLVEDNYRRNVAFCAKDRVLRDAKLV